MATRSILKLAAEKAASHQDAVSQVALAPFLRGEGALKPLDPSELTGNMGRLMLGYAQHIRVNDPNITHKPDRFGNTPVSEPSIGLARNRVEIGGPLTGAGMHFATYLSSGAVDVDRQKYRTARIVKLQISHMHCTGPSIHVDGRGKWRVEFETVGAWKDMMDGSNSSADPFIKTSIFGFSSSQAAIAYCHEFGFAYEVEIPRERYHTKKSYADNFKWRGPDN